MTAESQGIIIAGFKLEISSRITQKKIYEILNKYKDYRNSTNIIYLPTINKDYKIYISLNFYLLPRNGIVNATEIQSVLNTRHIPVPAYFSEIIRELSATVSNYSVYCDHVDRGIEILL